MFKAIVILLFIGHTLSLNENTWHYSNSQLLPIMCSNYNSRDQLINKQAKAQAQGNKQMMRVFYKQSGNQIINRIVRSSNQQQALIIAKQLSMSFVLFDGIFAIGFVFIIILSMILGCCCCFSCCPFQNSKKKMSPCQKVWPSIALILCFLGLCIPSAFGYFRARDIQTTYEAVGCSVGIVLNDMVYGNVSDSGKFFTGISNILKGLYDFQLNMTEVKEQIDKVQFTNTTGVLRSAYQQGNSLINLISEIPNGTINGIMPNFAYSHFDGTGSSSDVPSIFAEYLGYADGLNGKGIINITYSTFYIANQMLKQVGMNAETFSSSFDSVNGTIRSLQYSMQQMETQILKTQKQMVDAHNAIKWYKQNTSSYIKTAFIVFFSMGLVGIATTVAMTFFDMFKLRYLLYFVCFCLVFVAIFTFLLAFVFSLLTTTVYFGCDFLDVSLGSPTQFSYNLQPFIGQQAAYQFQVCLQGQSGDIINQVRGINMSALNSLNDCIQQMRSFNITQIQTGLTNSMNSMSNEIDKYFYTDLLDFNSDYDKNYMTKLSNPTEYSGCTFNSFSQDSWVPSLNLKQIACIGTTSSATNIQCPDSSAIVNGRGNSTDSIGCFGCMDTMKVLLKSTNILNDLSQRYGMEEDCQQWASDMNNLWVNYYSIKINEISPIKQRSLLANTQYLSSTGYKERISSVSDQFDAVVTNLEQMVSSVFDPKQGMIAGLNCLLLGEDANLIVDTACISMFNTFYSLRLLLGISSFAILFLTCCATLSGVKAQKNSVFNSRKREQNLLQSENSAYFLQN